MPLEEKKPLPDKIQRCKRGLDDWRSPFFNSLVDEKGRLRGDIRISEEGLKKFLENRGQYRVQSSAHFLLNKGHAEFVRQILLRQLDLMIRWGKVRDPAKDDDWLIGFRRIAQLLFARSSQVSMWIIGAGLPAVAGVDWNEAIALIASARRSGYRSRRKLLRRLEPVRDLVEMSAFDAKLAKIRRHRTRPGETPRYIYDAIVLLKQSEGKFSARRIAGELGIDHTMLSTNPTFREAKLWYAPGAPSAHTPPDEDS